MGQPFEIAGQTVRVTLSVGIAFDPEGEDPEEIIRKADRALYRAKRAALYEAARDEGEKRTSRAVDSGDLVVNEY